MMKLIRFFQSIFFYLWREKIYIIFFTFIFSLFSLLYTFILTPQFDSKSKILLTRSMIGNLPSIGGFSLSSFLGGVGGGSIFDETEFIVSDDIKKKAFYEWAMKIKWYKIDKDIRRYIAFSPISLDCYPKTIKLKVISDNKFKVYLSYKDDNVLSKVLSTIGIKKYRYIGEYSVGELVDLGGFSFILTKPFLKKGKVYKIEIGYKYPRAVYEKLFSLLSVGGIEYTNVMILYFSYSDPVMVTEFLNFYLEKYIEERYYRIEKDKDHVLIIIKHSIDSINQELDSLNRAFSEFSKKNKIISPEEEMPVLIQMLGDLIKAKLELEMKYRFYSNYTTNSFKRKAILTQISSLDKEIQQLKDRIYEKYPNSLGEYLSLKTALEAKQRVYGGLLVQLEQTKIAKLQEIGSRWIIQSPQFPYLRTKPRRLKTLIVFSFMGFMLGIFFLLYKRFTHEYITSIFDLPWDSKIITITKSEDMKDRISKELIDIDKNHTIVAFFYKVEETIKDIFISYGIEKIIGNLEINYPVIEDYKIIIIPLKYNQIEKQYLNKIIEKLKNKEIIFLVYDIEISSTDFIWEYIV